MKENNGSSGKQWSCGTIAENNCNRDCVLERQRKLMNGKRRKMLNGILEKSESYEENIGIIEEMAENDKEKWNRTSSN